MTALITLCSTQPGSNAPWWVVDVVVEAPDYVYHSEADDLAMAYKKIFMAMGDDLAALTPAFDKEEIKGTSFDVDPLDVTDYGSLP